MVKRLEIVESNGHNQGKDAVHHCTSKAGEGKEIKASFIET